MKTTLFIILLLFFTHSSAESLEIFGTKLELNSECKLITSKLNNQAKVIDLKLPPSPNCTFIKHSKTNIPHIERVNNFYVVLIESTEIIDNNCISTYTGIAIQPNGNVYASNVKKTSGTCNIGREEKVFKYFANKFKFD